MSFYVKSHPKAGVLSLSLLFPRIIILTTGSGIGPALSSLLERPRHQHARLIWSTRSPLATYGQDIMDLVVKADPEAIVLDTDAMGRPDLLGLVWGVARREGAEAVFVLSNERVVRWIVGGLEDRGVCAYGPIWDS
jgi:ferredoxin-NADP reductase